MFERSWATNHARACLDIFRSSMTHSEDVTSIEYWTLWHTQFSLKPLVFAANIITMGWTFLPKFQLRHIIDSMLQKPNIQLRLCHGVITHSCVGWFGNNCWEPWGSDVFQPNGCWIRSSCGKLFWLVAPWPSISARVENQIIQVRLWRKRSFC